MSTRVTVDVAGSTSKYTEMRCLLNPSRICMKPTERGLAGSKRTRRPPSSSTDKPRSARSISAGARSSGGSKRITLETNALGFGISTSRNQGQGQEFQCSMNIRVFGHKSRIRSHYFRAKDQENLPIPVQQRTLGPPLGAQRREETSRKLVLHLCASRIAPSIS